jgi:hypothetical protein
MIEIEFRELVNTIIESELKLVRKDFSPLGETSILSSSGIDSLEYMVLYMWVGEIFGISNEKFSTIEIVGDVTLDALHRFVLKYMTKTPSKDEAIALYTSS